MLGPPLGLECITREAQMKRITAGGLIITDEQYKRVRSMSIEEYARGLLNTAAKHGFGDHELAAILRSTEMVPDEKKAEVLEMARALAPPKPGELIH